MRLAAVPIDVDMGVAADGADEMIGNGEYGIRLRDGGLGRCGSVSLRIETRGDASDKSSRTLRRRVAGE